MSGDKREGTEDFIDALAGRVADGRGDANAAAPADADPRVVANLQRLSALHAVFSDRPPSAAGGEPGAGATSTDGTTDADDPVPTVWGHLQIIDRLGAGGFGIVHRAYDPILQREVALKLRRASRSHDGAPQAYIDEARQLARVRHPNVLAVHGAGVNDQRAGIWADLIVGETLEARLARGERCDGHALLDLATQAAAALAAIHAAGLVHGDVKAANVMIEGERLVLMDFGASLAAGQQPRQGSPATMAPELLDGAAASPAADVYSLGALLFRLASGRHPSRAAGDAAADRRELRRAVGQPLAKLVSDMLSAAPAQRPDAARIVATLARIRALPARRRRQLAVAAVIASLAVGLTLSLLSLQREKHERARSEAVTAVLTASVQALGPSRTNEPATLRTLFDNIAAGSAADLDAFPDAQADLLVVAGRGIADFGDRAQGLAVAERGWALMQQSPDTGIGNRAGAAALLGILRRQNGDFDGAERAASEAIALYDTFPKADREAATSVIRVRTLLANLLRDRGRWREAVAANERLIADRTALLGADSPELAVDYYNLATTLTQLGRGADAIVAFDDASARLARAGQGDSMRAAMVRHGRLRALTYTGKPTEALREVAAVRTRYERELAPNHENLVSLALNEAAALREAGRPAEAADKLRTHIASEQDDDSISADTWFVLAHALADTGEHAQASAAFLRGTQKMTAARAPLAPYARAGLEWFRFRAGERSDAPLPELDAAIAQMQADGNTTLREFVELTNWRDSTRTGPDADPVEPRP